MFAHGVAFEIQAIAVVHESIQDGVGERGLIQIRVPVFNGQLAGDESGFLVVAVVEDFEEIAFALIG